MHQGGLRVPRFPPAFAGLDAMVVGVSKDSIARHDRFKAKHDLPFTLAADLDGGVCDAYGTWVEKSMYGRSYMGIERATFLIDETGVIRGIWRKVRSTATWRACWRPSNRCDAQCRRGSLR